MNYHFPLNVLTTTVLNSRKMYEIDVKDGCYSLLGIMVGMNAQDIPNVISGFKQQSYGDPYALRYECKMKGPDIDLILSYNVDRVISKIQYRIYGEREYALNWRKMAFSKLNSISQKSDTVSFPNHSVYRFVSEKDEIVVTFRDVFKINTNEITGGSINVEIERRVLPFVKKQSLIERLLRNSSK